MIGIHSYTCKVTAERDQLNKCKVKWVLDYLDPCECTRLAIGGFTLWIPQRQYTPVFAESPLVSDDISKFRMHYGIECEEGSKCLVNSIPYTIIVGV